MYLRSLISYLDMENWVSFIMCENEPHSGIA